MQKVPINLVTPGMVLAKSIMSDKGMPLCAEGTELTETLIERLRAMSIPALTVKGHPIDSGTPTKTLDEKLAELTARFARVRGDIVMDRIHDAIAAALEAEAKEVQAIEAREKEGGA